MFKEMIDDIYESAPGMDNVILCGTDGIAVASKFERDEDEMLVVEAATLVKDCQRFGEEIEGGPVQGITLKYGESTVLIQTVTEEYFLIGVAKNSAIMGRIRYHFTLKSYEWYSSIA